MILQNPYNNIANIYNQWIQGDYASNDFLNFYLKLTSKVDKNIEIVELGIGTGRIAIAIAKQQNRNVIGVDSSLEMLKKCKENIKNNFLEEKIKLIHSDILELNLNKKAQFMILPFRTIGHFLTLDDKKKVLQQVYNNLQDNGIFIFDHYIFNYEWSLKNNNTFIEMYRENNFVIYDKYIFNYQTKILNCNVYKEINGIKSKIISFDYSWIEPDEIKSIIDDVGFRVEYSYGDFNFNLLDKKSKEQIWVLRK